MNRPLSHIITPVRTLSVLFPLIAVNKDQSVTQLKLALAWNRADVAKSLIFAEDKKWEVRSKTQKKLDSSFANGTESQLLLPANEVAGR